MNIPDSDLLFRGVHPTQIKSDGSTVSSGAFFSRKNRNPSLDWSRFSTPHETFARRRAQADCAGVAQITAQAVRQLDASVRWAPIPGNRAHTLIVRNLILSDAEWKRTCKRLARQCTWAIAPAEAWPQT
jgi:hypothetical protein